VGKVGVAVDFDGSASDDPDGAITQHDWDFGDGDSAIDAGPRPSHTYETTGVYPVVLTVTDTASSVVQVFVTSGAYTGNLGDQAGGDAACTAAATDAGLAGTWTAWLGKGSCGACMDPKDRIQDGEYQLLDGTIVANNRADLLDGTLDAPINMDETGTTLVGAFEVWTGTDPDGTGGSGPGTCTVWTTNSVETRGQSGTANATDAKWTDNRSETCDVFNRLYCFADVPVENEGATAMDSTQALIGDGVNLPPTADPGGPYPGEEDLALIFDATASDDPDGDIVSWDWNFGDEETGTGETPVHTYAAAGNYLVTLTVADDGDKTDTKTTVAAIGMGNQSPTSDADGPYPGAVGVPVQFDGTGSDDADGYLVSAEWDFGDTGKGSGLVPAHTYMESGPYTATLIVTDNDGATDQAEAQVIIGDGLSLPPTADADGPYVGIAGAPVTFDGSASDDLDGTIERYDWVFGDGSTADDAGPEPDNTYLAGDIYSVILEVTDDDDLVSSDSSNAFIGEFSLLPTADANGPYNGRMGAAVTFDGTASTDPDGTIVSWNWDFGDGNTGTGPTPTNTYASDGSYIVKLTVTDDSSETDTDVTTAAIGRGNLSPVANAGGPYNGATDVAVTFDSTGSGDLDGSIVSYTWDFGDGNTGDGPRPSYTYSTPGTYFVTLTVVDDSDTSDSDGAVAVIGDNQPPVCLQAIPSIERIWPPNHKFVPVTVQGVTDPDGDPVSIRIDSIFQDEPVDDRGDGASSPDGEGVGTATANVRAERSGSSGNGRAYHIGYTADDGQGGSCSGHVVVGVPHSRKAVVVDDGATFDSTMMGDATGKKAVKKKTRAKKQKDRRRERRTHRSRGAPGP